MGKASPKAAPPPGGDSAQTRPPFASAKLAGDRQSQSAPFSVVVSRKPHERLEDLVQIVEA